MAPHSASVLALLLVVAGCGDRAPRSSCGVAALAGPTLLLDQFSKPNQTLGQAPAVLPPRLVARLAAGPAYPAVVGRSDSLWVIGVEGQLPAGPEAGFGVLVLDPAGKARGVMLYPGLPIAGAPVIGSVTVQSSTVPLIGIRLDTLKYEDAACPYFPDSVLAR